MSEHEGLRTMLDKIPDGNPACLQLSQLFVAMLLEEFDAVKRAPAEETRKESPSDEH